MTNAKRFRSIRFGGLLAAALFLPVIGCGSSNDEFKTYSAESPPIADLAIPVRIERSDVVDFSNPNVEVNEGTVIVWGNLRIHSGKNNPQASLHISIVKRDGVLDHEMQAKLSDTDQPDVLQYKIRFGPVPAKGEWITVSYIDWHPENEYTGSAIGSGASDVGGAGKGGRNNTGDSNSPGKSVNTGSSTNRRAGGSSKGGPKIGGSTPQGGKLR